MTKILMRGGYKNMYELKINVSGVYFQTIIKIQTFGNISDREGIKSNTN